MIEVSDLSTTYSKGSGIKNISFKVKKGEILGILGPNGAGKSTLLKTLATYLKPTSGSFKILGHDGVKDENFIRENCGVLFETSSLFEELSGEENLKFIGQLHRCFNKEKADELLKDFFLFKEKDNSAGTYSFGMKRKIDLAGIFLKGPLLYLLDEPFTGLDPDSKKVVQEKIKSAAKSGATVILTTNEIREAEEICDRTFYINGGILFEKGSLEL